jgi:glycosyltransferase involved in cell wall biosynthesis
MPNHNHGQYIAEALDAIVNQSFKPFEVIVCDDGSTDNSVEIIQRFVDRYKFVRLIRNDSNAGIFSTLNNLVSLASGDYLYGAAADDRILPGFFEKSMAILRQNPQAGLSSALSLFTDKGGVARGIIQVPLVSRRSCFIAPDQVRELFITKGCWTLGITTIMKLACFKEEGGYRKELNSFCDGFIGQVVALKYGACFIPEPLTSWRRLEDSLAHKAGNNPQAYKKLIENSTSLMRNDYAGIFPDKYVEKWRNLNYVYLHSNILEKRYHEILTRLMTSSISPSWFKKALSVCLGYLFRINIFLAKCWLLIFLRAGIWQSITQKMDFYFYKTFLLKTDKRVLHG